MCRTITPPQDLYRTRGCREGRRINRFSPRPKVRGRFMVTQETKLMADVQKPNTQRWQA
jgi:hypothetical protein